MANLTEQHAAQQCVAADYQQLGSIDLDCRLAAYCVGRIGSDQRCCWPPNRRSVRRQELPILESLGNLGDFVGGLAVVVTLVYLAVQIRQNSRHMQLNTAAVQAAAYQAQLESTRLANMDIVRDKQLAEWTLISASELEKLDRADRFRLELLLLGALRQRQHLFVQAQDGLIRPDLVATHNAGLVGLFGNPALRALWSRSKGQFIPDFVRHVDELLANSDEILPAV